MLHILIFFQCPSSMQVDLLYISVKFDIWMQLLQRKPHTWGWTQHFLVFRYDAHVITGISVWITLAWMFISHCHWQQFGWCYIKSKHWYLQLKYEKWKQNLLGLTLKGHGKDGISVTERNAYRTSKRLWYNIFATLVMDESWLSCGQRKSKAVHMWT